MCRDRLIVPPPHTFAVYALSRSSASEARCLSEAHKLSVQPWVKTEPTWTNTGPSFPTAGAPEGGLCRGLWANMEITVGIKECIWQKPIQELIHREILKIKVAYYHKGEGSPYIPSQLAIYFFALVVTLYWALSDWTVHYTNVQGKKYCFYTIHFLKYIQSKISYRYLHELQPVCTSPVHLGLLTCMYEKERVCKYQSMSNAFTRSHSSSHTHKCLWYFLQAATYLVIDYGFCMSSPVKAESSPQCRSIKLNI